MEKIAEKKNCSSSCCSSCWLPIMTTRVAPTQHHTKNASSSLSSSLSSSSSACTTQSVQKSLIAGYIAGTIGVIIGYPLDSFKVWIQTNTHKNNINNPPFQTTSVPAAVGGGGGGVTASPLHNNQQQQQQQAGMLTIRSCPRTGTRAASSLATVTTTTTTTSTSSCATSRFQGMLQWTRALNRGVAGPLVTVGLVQGLNFAIYDSTRRALYAASTSHNNDNNKDYLQDDSSCLLHVGVASVTAGAVLAFITSPLLMIKTKQQVQQISFAQAARQMVQRRGGGVMMMMMMMTRGFGPHFVSETVGRGIYFCVYEKCKQSWIKHDSSTRTTSSTTRTIVQQQPQTSSTSSISLTGRMASAGVAGMACWTILFPLDVLRNRLFATTEQQYLSTWTMAQRIYQEGGVRGFYRGYGISIFRAGPVAALVLPIYDMTLEHLNK